MTNRTFEMLDLPLEERNRRIREADTKVHDLRPILLDKMKHRIAFARVEAPKDIA